MLIDATTLLHARLLTDSNAQEIADDCGVSLALVLAWAKGKHAPDKVSRLILEQDYNIPASAWK